MNSNNNSMQNTQNSTFTESKAIELYEIVIKALADSKGDKLFENSGQFHAAIVLSNIFRTAKEDVVMFSGDFNGAVSDQDLYLTELKAFLKRGRSLSVLFQESPNQSSKALKILQDYKGRCLVKLMRLEKNTFDTSPHFTVADGRMFRLEEDTKNFKAICSFNNRGISEKLLKFYDELKLNSKPLIFV